MSEKIYAKVRADVAEAEKALVVAKDIVERLRRAGEDVAEHLKRQQQLETRVRRYKAAFAE